MPVARKVGRRAFRVLAWVALSLVGFIMLLPSLTHAQKGGSKKYAVNSHGIVDLCGRKFTYSNATTDTIEVNVPGKDEGVAKIIKTNGYPIQLEGKHIQDGQPVFNVPFEEHLYRKLKKLLLQLPDGYYNLGVYNIIVDDNGRTCAFSYEGCSGSTEEGGKGKAIKINARAAAIVFDETCNVMANLPAFSPPVVNGKKVVSVSNPIYPNEFKIEKHKLHLKRKGVWLVL